MAAHQGFKRRVGHSHPLQPHMGGLAVDEMEQIGEESGQKITHRHSKEAARLAQFKDLWGRKGLCHLMQQRAQLALQMQGKGAGHHFSALAHQQGVVQLLAQPFEGVADGRLRALQSHSGFGDAALLHQGVQHDQEIEIDLAQIRVVGYMNVLHE